MVFLAMRLESVRGQLAGTHQGYLPYWQKGLFGVGSPPDRRPRAGSPATRPTTAPATPRGK
jgi:hypothetical protein